MVFFPRVLLLVRRPVPGCCAVAHSAGRMQEHFVTKFSVTDSGGTGGKGTTAQLRLVWNAQASRLAHQASPDSTMRLEYADEVAEKGCGDSR